MSLVRTPGIVLLLVLLLGCSSESPLECASGTTPTYTCGPVDQVLETCEPVLSTSGKVCQSQADCRGTDGEGACLLTPEIVSAHCEVESRSTILCDARTKGICSDVSHFYISGWSLAELGEEAVRARRLQAPLCG